MTMTPCRWFVSTPVVLNGMSPVLPAAGTNYLAWAAVGFVFQHLVCKRNFAWWSMFNHVISVALDSGVFDVWDSCLVWRSWCFNRYHLRLISTEVLEDQGNNRNPHLCSTWLNSSKNKYLTPTFQDFSWNVPWYVYVGTGDTYPSCTCWLRRLNLDLNR